MSSRWRRWRSRRRLHPRASCGFRYWRKQGKRRRPRRAQGRPLSTTGRAASTIVIHRDSCSRPWRRLDERLALRPMSSVQVYRRPMRRTTPGILGAHELVDRRIARAEAHDPDLLVRTLEPIVTDSRRARLLEVIGKRLGSVAVVFDRPYDPSQRRGRRAIVRGLWRPASARDRARRDPLRRCTVGGAGSREVDRRPLPHHRGVGRGLGARDRYAPRGDASRGRARGPTSWQACRGSGWSSEMSERESMASSPLGARRGSGCRCAASSRASTSA